MDQLIEGQNPYELLGLENGQQSTLQDIKTVCMHPTDGSSSTPACVLHQKA